MSVKEFDIITFCIHYSHSCIQFVSIYNLFELIRHTYPIYEREIPTGNICIFINKNPLLCAKHLITLL